MRVGNKIGRWTFDITMAGIKPLLRDGEDVECLVRTMSLVPNHTEMFITNERVLVPSGLQSKKLLYDIQRSTLTEIDSKRAVSS